MDASHNIDVKNMSHIGYDVKKGSKMIQSHEFNFGKPTEIELEIIWCKRCKKECRTAVNVFTGEAVYGLCVGCGMQYFK